MRCFLSKEGNVLCNDALDTFHLRLYGVEHVVKDNSAREETHFRNYMSHCFRLVARVLLYELSHRRDSTYWNEK